MESHKEGVLDVFQEHVALCHDVVLLEVGKELEFQAKVQCSPPYGPTAVLKARRSCKFYGVSSRKETNLSFLTCFIPVLLHFPMAPRNPCLTCGLSTWTLTQPQYIPIVLPGLLIHWLLFAEVAKDSRHTSFFFRMVFLCKTFTA